MTLNTLLDHTRQKLSDQLTREFLYLLNKNAKTALQIASDKYSESPDDSARGQIYSEMNLLYQEKEKAVDEIVETLLKKDSLVNNESSAMAASMDHQSAS